MEIFPPKSQIFAQTNFSGSGKLPQSPKALEQECKYYIVESEIGLGYWKVSVYVVFIVIVVFDIVVLFVFVVFVVVFLLLLSLLSGLVWIILKRKNARIWYFTL